ncbi:radial spoke head protein, putative [Plasmodium malariae]|uniref:Radial spoke head protein, putative n=1 Tax=Plasmodium malariae TaxID=5858 RepID=A0A1A8W1S8_PLAMA|nr:radial spoke head protein, putative [Plasmodium malariae]
MKSNLLLSLNNAKDYLKKRNENGESVYDHICDIINFIVVEKPDKCYENFEIISSHIKESKKNGCTSSNDVNSNKVGQIDLKDNNLDNYILSDYIKKKKEWLEKIKFLFQKSSENKPIRLPFIRNLYEQVKLINWAGYNIKKDLICYINNSIKQILKQYKEELISLNFWGILKGIKNDYYILEGQLKKDTNIFSRKKKNSIYSDDSTREVSSNGGSSSSILKNDNSSRGRGSRDNDSRSNESRNSSSRGRGSRDNDSRSNESRNSSNRDSNSRGNNHSDNDDELYDKRGDKGRRGKTKRPGREKRKPSSSGKYAYTKEDYNHFNKNVNKHVYWVSINGTDKWILLKFTTPEYIKIASQTNKILTGNMNHIITSFPNIAIKEKHYLRAIISIISSNTHISPKNYYISKSKNKINRKKKRKKRRNNRGNDEGEQDEEENEEDDEDEDEEDEEDEDDKQRYDEEEESQEEHRDQNEEEEQEEKEDYETPYNDEIVENKKFQYDTNFLQNIENWVYSKHHFLPNGHIDYPKKMKSKRNKKIQNIIKQNPPLKVLRNINPQKENQHSHTWKIKHLNHGHYYGVHNSHYDIIIIYNFFFYGAFTVYFNKQYFNFYIGNGIKSKHAFIHTYQPGKVYSDKSELSEEDQTS